MSRFNLPETQPIYDAAQAFVDQGLRADDSLFTPGRPIWTAANLEEIYRRFNRSPDESGDSFERKFRRQLDGAAPEVYQLAGELLYVHLLIAVGNIGPAAKRGLVNRVLGWSQAPVSIPPERDAALSRGLARVGIAYLTFRPFQLWFLIDFTRAFKRQPPAERERLLADPWAFKEFLFGLPIDRAYAQREALLHLVHPDSFEAIVSRDHKQRFARDFAAYVATPSPDVDRQLAQIRAEVDRRYGPGRSLYTLPTGGHGGTTPDPPEPSPLPRTLGPRLRPYVALVAGLDGSGYSPQQIVERLGRISPPLTDLPAMPEPAALVADLMRLRLLKPIEASGNYRRWSFLDGAGEPLLLRYAALTLLAPAEGGGYELPLLRAPLDGAPHPEAAWPLGRDLLAWYVEAGLVELAGEGLWRSRERALAPQPGETEAARAINTFLQHLAAVRSSSAELPPLSDDALPLLDPDLLAERIAEIQRELLIDRAIILRIYRALIAGHHVILSGPPGTGKTHLARLLPRVLWRDADPAVARTLPADPALPPTEPPVEAPLYREGYLADVVTATEDWGVRNVIGGIAPRISRDGERSSLVYQVSHGVLTRAALANYADYDGTRPPAAARRADIRAGGARYRGRWLIIDEFTRAPIDAAFGSLLTTLGGQRSPLAVPTEEGEVMVPLPRDFRIIGTLNSFDRHFLNQISEAMKRRFTFIDVLPPGPALAAQERGMAVYRALLRLAEQGMFDISVDLADGEATWEGVLRVARGEEGLALAFEPGEGELARAALDSFWHIFRAVRVYRQLGTAQAEAVCSALFSGQLIGMGWAEALDSALADTLADQLQVLSRDEQRMLLAYLRHAADGPAFAGRALAVLNDAPAARQRAHLGLLGMSAPAQLTAEALRGRFDLDQPLIVPGNGLFAQRLESFVNERGL